VSGGGAGVEVSDGGTREDRVIRKAKPVAADLRRKAQIGKDRDIGKSPESESQNFTAETRRNNGRRLTADQH
jgi:hypothetical protein